MYTDIANFRIAATAYYLHISDTDDKDLGVDAFEQSLTYQWARAQLSLAINQLIDQLTWDIADNPMPSFVSWFNSTDQDVARLAGYVKAANGGT